MGFFALFNCYTLRVNLSVAIVVMVNSTYLHELERADARNLTDSGSSNDPCGGVDSSSNLTDVEQVLNLRDAERRRSVVKYGESVSVRSSYQAVSDNTVCQ